MAMKEIKHIHDWMIVQITDEINGKVAWACETCEETVEVDVLNPEDAYKVTLNNFTTYKFDQFGIITSTDSHRTLENAEEHVKLMKKFHDVDLKILDHSKT
jgi:hypothetical protein